MARVYRNMGLHTLYDQPKVASLDDVLILNDNFENPIHMDSTINSLFKGTYHKISDTITVTICLEGSVDVSVNLKEYRLGKNDVVINRSGTLGNFHGMSDNTRFILLIVSNRFYYPALISGDTSELQNLTVTHPVWHLPDETATSVVRQYETLKERLNCEPRPGYIYELTRGMVDAMMFTMFSELKEQVRIEEQQHQRLTRGQDIYNRFMLLVENHFMRERNTQFYADKLCISPKYLSQLIYKECGSYANEIIRHFVILEAKTLIKSKHYTISQVCDMLNFSSQSFFTKYFRNATGMTPTEYQNS